jgi:hypothetical protein
MFLCPSGHRCPTVPAQCKPLNPPCSPLHVDGSANVGAWGLLSQIYTEIKKEYPEFNPPKHGYESPSLALHASYRHGAC